MQLRMLLGRQADGSGGHNEPDTASQLRIGVLSGEEINQPFHVRHRPSQNTQNITPERLLTDS